MSQCSLSSITVIVMTAALLSPWRDWISTQGSTAPWPTHQFMTKIMAVIVSTDLVPHSATTFDVLTQDESSMPGRSKKSAASSCLMPFNPHIIAMGQKSKRQTEGYGFQLFLDSNILGSCSSLSELVHWSPRPSRPSPYKGETFQ
jgi:hypothetical protein